jgi:hypothetical protein
VCYFAGFEVPTATAMKSSVFWDITPCSLVKADFTEEHIVSIFRIEEHFTSVLLR